jgi:hypothetical protein
MFLSALLLLAQIATSQAQAAPLFSNHSDLKFMTLVCSIKLADSPALWVKLRRNLDARLSNGDKYVSRILAKNTVIERVITEIGNGHTGHVYSVQTSTGRMALKLYPKNIMHEQMSRPILIQQILGALGVAPKLEGVLSGPEVKALVHRFPLLREHSFGFGLLMEEIKYSWASKSTELPNGLGLWELGRMSQRLDQISETLNKLGILSQDEQVLITTYGKIYLSDFDLYSWVKPGAEYEDELLEKERFRPLKRMINNIH